MNPQEIKEWLIETEKYKTILNSSNAKLKESYENRPRCIISDTDGKGNEEPYVLAALDDSGLICIKESVLTISEAMELVDWILNINAAIGKGKEDEQRKTRDTSHYNDLTNKLLKEHISTSKS